MFILNVLQLREYKTGFCIFCKNNSTFRNNADNSKKENMITFQNSHLSKNITVIDVHPQSDTEWEKHSAIKQSNCRDIVTIQISHFCKFGGSRNVHFKVEILIAVGFVNSDIGEQNVLAKLRDGRLTEAGGVVGHAASKCLIFSIFSR